MKRFGKIWYHGNKGRHWIHFGESGHVLSLEVSRRGFSPGVDIRWGVEQPGDGGVMLHASLWVNVFLSWQMPYGLLRKLRFPKYERRFGLRWFMGRFQVELFSDNWGRAIGMSDNEHVFTLWANEWITGRWKHSRREIVTTTGTVVVSEREQYSVTVTITELRWKNRLREKRALSAWMDLIHRPGDPFPDTEYKWGDRDGIFGLSFDITNTGDIDAALEYYAERVRSERIKHNYTPLAAVVDV